MVLMGGCRFPVDIAYDIEYPTHLTHVLGYIIYKQAAYFETKIGCKLQYDKTSYQLANMFTNETQSIYTEKNEDYTEKNEGCPTISVYGVVSFESDMFFF